MTFDFLTPFFLHRHRVLTSTRNLLRPTRQQPSYTIKISITHQIPKSKARENLRRFTTHPPRAQEHKPPSLHHASKRTHHQRFHKPNILKPMGPKQRFTILPSHPHSLPPRWQRNHKLHNQRNMVQPRPRNA